MGERSQAFMSVPSMPSRHMPMTEKPGARQEDAEEEAFEGGILGAALSTLISRP